MKNQTRMILEQYMKEWNLQHYGEVEQLAAAFLAKTGIDPELAEVVSEVTHSPDGGITFRTRIERRKHGVGQVNKV